MPQVLTHPLVLVLPQTPFRNISFPYSRNVSSKSPSSKRTFTQWGLLLQIFKWSSYVLLYYRYFLLVCGIPFFPYFTFNSIPLAFLWFSCYRLNASVSTTNPIQSKTFLNLVAILPFRITGKSDVFFPCFLVFKTPSTIIPSFIFWSYIVDYKDFLPSLILLCFYWFLYSFEKSSRHIH